MLPAMGCWLLCCDVHAGQMDGWMEGGSDGGMDGCVTTAVSGAPTNLVPRHDLYVVVLLMPCAHHAGPQLLFMPLCVHEVNWMVSAHSQFVWMRSLLLPLLLVHNGINAPSS